MFRYETLQQRNSYYRSKKARNLMNRLFLHFWNVSATFRIWSSGRKNPYLKYVSLHFLTLEIALHLVRIGLHTSLLHLNNTPTLVIRANDLVQSQCHFSFRSVAH